MLKKIYEVMADKTLTTGCRIQRRAYREVDGVKWAKPRDWVVWQRFDGIDCVWLGMFYSDTWTYAVTEFESNILNERDNEGGLVYTIIWHPVMIGDVLDWMYENNIPTNKHNAVSKEICWYHANYLWENKRLPIDQQSDECIAYVYDLVCNTL